MASVSHCPVVIQFICVPCCEGKYDDEGKCQRRGMANRVFPTLGQVRWWQSWLSHVGTGYV